MCFYPFVWMEEDKSWADGWVNGWMDRWKDGWMKVCVAEAFLSSPSMRISHFLANLPAWPTVTQRKCPSLT